MDRSKVWEEFTQFSILCSSDATRLETGRVEVRTDCWLNQANDTDCMVWLILRALAI